MEDMIYLGQSDDFESQFGWVNITNLSAEDFEKESQEYYANLEKDLSYGQDALDMLNQLEVLADKIREKGVPQKRINQAVRGLPDLEDIHITKDYKILIPKRANVEIKLTQIPKALYFLFLRHKDGLFRKDLHTLEDEVIMIMKAILKTDELTTSKMRAIKNLISKDKVKSFSDACDSIKKEFMKVFDEEVAFYYYISGEKEEIRGIRLPRHQVKVG